MKRRIEEIKQHEEWDLDSWHLLIGVVGDLVEYYFDHQADVVTLKDRLNKIEERVHNIQDELQEANGYFEEGYTGTESS